MPLFLSRIEILDNAFNNHLKYNSLRAQLRAHFLSSMWKFFWELILRSFSSAFSWRSSATRLWRRLFSFAFLERFRNFLLIVCFLVSPEPISRLSRRCSISVLLWSETFDDMGFLFDLIGLCFSSEITKVSSSLIRDIQLSF